MLARTAEYLFWSGRYLVRAEDTARLLDVTYHRLLEATAAEEAVAWTDVLDATAMTEEFLARHRNSSNPAVRGSAVSEFLVLDRTNRGSIVSCVDQARINARGVREHLTVEFWEALNSFHLEMGARNLAFQLATQPSDLYHFVRTGVQSVLGVADGTWTRDDGWRFFMLGVHLERAEVVARLLRVRHGRHKPADIHEWYATLRTTAALSAYRRRYRDLDPVSIIDLLLLSADLPRSVLFSLGHSDQILRRVVDPDGSAAVRLLGRARASLEFADATELVDSGGAQDLLDDLDSRIAEISAAVAAECFLYRVELDLHSMQVFPGELTFGPDHGEAAAAGTAEGQP